jgi:transcriptional regulator with XRE-family HTH domain
MPTPNVLLRHERQLRGWSQAHLAEQIDVPDYYISRWERGEVLPSPYYQQKLCEVFGKTAEELGMLQTTPLTLPVDPPMVEQLPFPQPQVDPNLITPTLKQPRSTRKGKPPALLALVILVLISAGLGTILLSRASPMPVSSVVGHLYFLSSEQTGVNGNQGIADEVRIDLQSPRSPSDGKSYYAWLLPDENKVENQVVPLGKVEVSAGTGTVSYSDPQHTNLLAITSGFLITEQDTTVTPLYPSTDRSDWRYIGHIPQTKPPGVQYSLLDHLRHLLAEDPKLKANNLLGGLTIWLYRNTQSVYGWSIAARDDWQSGGSANVSLMSKDVIRILDCLDGISYVWKDLPAASPVLVDSRIGRIGLLQFTPLQNPPGYLDHIVLHLNGLTSSPGANSFLQQRAAQIIAAINTVNGWLEQIRQDAKQLAAIIDKQLQQQALTLLNDMATKASFALNGENNPVTGNMQEGVEWIFQAIQSLATMDIMLYRGQNLL